MGQIPTTSPESVTLSKDMRRRGFKFVGPVICYALMQAIGMVNDHTVNCFRHKELKYISKGYGGATHEAQRMANPGHRHCRGAGNKKA
jgi:hypothetical protein